MKIGARIIVYNAKMREARAKMGLTQKALADILGIGIGDIQNIETLLLPYVDYQKTMGILINIADFLHIPFNEIFPSDYLFALQEKLLPKNRSLTITKEIEIASLDALEVREDFYLPEDIIEKKVLKEKIQALLDELPAREREVVVLRYGLRGDEPLLLEDCARKFGITSERVRQIEAMALSRLRNPKRIFRIRDFAGEE